MRERRGEERRGEERRGEEKEPARIGCVCGCGGRYAPLFCEGAEGPLSCAAVWEQWM